jgi:hypothetical protein
VNHNPIPLLPQELCISQLKENKTDFIPTAFLEPMIRSKYPKSKFIQKCARLYLNLFPVHQKNFILKYDTSNLSSSWSKYQDYKSYSELGLQHKIQVITELVQKISPSIILDLGANDGQISREMSQFAKLVVACDSDAACVEKNFNACRTQGILNVLPIITDILRPEESFFERMQGDLVTAFALIHHLTIVQGITFELFFSLLSQSTSKFALVEFVPKEDEKVQKMMKWYNKNYDWYNLQNFEKAARKIFSLHQKFSIEESSRIIFFLEKLPGNGFIS